jgi:hypothetical protein
MTIFVTADIPAYACADSLLEQCWRRAVGPEDLVYVIAGDSSHWVLPQIDLLPGRIRLVLHPMSVDEDLVLSPVPLAPEALAGTINLHGRRLHALPKQQRQLCVSIDATGVRPLALSEARARATSRNGMATPPLRMVSAADDTFSPGPDGGRLLPAG